METELQADKGQWSSIVFSFDNEGFRKGFESGSRYYFVDTNREKPQRTAKLSARELLHQSAVTDAGSSHYSFDDEGIDYLVEHLGVFLGYMSGTLQVSAIANE